MSNKKFEMQDKDETRFISLECKCCSQVFGIKAEFADVIGEANFHYRCPYCENVASIKE